MTRPFQLCDAVRVSAAFLRSIDPAASKGWPSRYDPGKGRIIGIIPCGSIVLLEIWFYDINQPKTYNSANIIHDDPKTVYNEAMRAEHKSRRVD